MGCRIISFDELNEIYSSNGELVCFSLNPLNTKFSWKYLSELLQTRKKYQEMKVFIPELPSDEKSEQEILLRHSAWQRVFHVLLGAGIPTFQACELIVGWSKIKENSHYKHSYSKIMKRFCEDAEFRTGLRDIFRTDDVLKHLMTLPILFYSHQIFNVSNAVICVDYEVAQIEGLVSLSGVLSNQQLPSDFLKIV